MEAKPLLLYITSYNLQKIMKIPAKLCDTIFFTSDISIHHQHTEKEIRKAILIIIATQESLGINLTNEVK